MFSKIIGLSLKIKNFLKGKKIYIAAAVLILQALLGYAGELLDLASAADFINWCGGLASNDFTARLIEGLGIFGPRFAFGGKASPQNQAKAD